MAIHSLSVLSRRQFLGAAAAATAAAYLNNAKVSWAQSLPVPVTEGRAWGLGGHTRQLTLTSALPFHAGLLFSFQRMPGLKSFPSHRLMEFHRQHTRIPSKIPVGREDLPITSIGYRADQKVNG